MTLSEKIKLLLTSKSKLKARINFLEDLVERYKASRDSSDNYIRQLTLENEHLLKTIRENDHKIQVSDRYRFTTKHNK
jgi:hypothetical protein